MNSKPEEVMTSESSSIRDHLANERTQLAWVRTSANVIVVGLAVARFADGGDPSANSLVAGGLLILVGALGVVYGTMRFRRSAAAITRGDIAGISSSLGPSVAAFVLLGAVLVSTVVLLVGA
jgi:putative membrane protein